MSKIIQTASGAKYRLVQRVSDDGLHPYEEIEPVIDLATQLGIDDTSQLSSELMMKAESVASMLSSQYPELVQEDLEQLREAVAALHSATSASGTQQAADAVFFTARNLKGQGGSFGYPLVTTIAGLLCRLIKQARVIDRQIIKSIDIHVDAIALVISDAITDPKSSEGKRLADEVGALTLRLVGEEKAG